MQSSTAVRWAVLLAGVILASLGVLFATSIDQAEGEAQRTEPPPFLKSHAFTDLARKSLKGSSSEPPVRGGTLTTSWFTDPQTLNNITRYDSYANRVCRYFLFPPLLDIDGSTLELRPELAASFPELSGDHRTQTWTLKKGVCWHRGLADGTVVEVTTRDVQFCFDLIKNEKLAAPHLQSPLAKFKSLEVVDAYTFRIKLDEPYARAVYDFGWEFRLMPAHLVTAPPERFDEDPLSREPVGYGPFRVEKWDRGSHLTLVRNLSYPSPAHKPYYVERLRLLFVRDLDQTLPLFRRGEIDIAVMNDPTRYEVARKEDDLRERATFHEYYLPRWLYIGWNNDHWAFRDPRVRRAMTFFFPREMMASRFYEGHAAVLSGPFAINAKGYNHAVKPLPFDPGAGEALLREAGFADHDGDGWLDRDGKKLEFVVLEPINNPAALESGFEMFQKELSKAGVAMTTEQMAFDVLLESRAKTHQFAAISLGWSPDPVDDDLFVVFHSSMCEGGNNFVNYRNPECDALLERARVEHDPQERIRISHRLHEIIDADHPMTFLINPESLVLVSTRIRDVNITQLGSLMYDWWIPK